jgi:ribonuclease HII
MTTTYPSFAYEATYWQQGIQHIAGIDEVGMGCLAGPVVAAAVILRPDTRLPGVNDSKLLLPKKREQLAAEIKVQAVAWAVNLSSVEEINMTNIRRASHLAMRRAVDTLAVQPHLLLIDGRPAQPHPRFPAAALIDGDALSYSIAAASILAKVFRDELMRRLHDEFPVYGFARHKGYGTPQHLAALQHYGPTLHHRTRYAPVARLLTRASLSA